jgi:hypothetical protein
MKKNASVKNKSVDSKEQAALPSRTLLAGEELLTLQMFMCTPDVSIEVEAGTNKTVLQLREVAKVGSFSLYNQFKPQDPAEAILAALSVEVKNVTSDCFMEAARMKAHPEIRSMHLKDGFRGALVTADLLDKLEQRRRNNPKAVTVGNVNVEAGGQAIVGNVQTGSQPQKAPKTEDAPSDAAPETDDVTE